jgi:hypothetical protein
MAKKSSKKQPASTSGVDANAPATRLSFFNFITIATTEDIENFINIAATTPEGENLKYLWERAYKEGFENGQKVIQPTLQRIGKKLEEKFDKGVARGMDLGREEGYMLAKQGFDGIVKGLKAREAPKVDTVVASTQTDPRAITTESTSTQTNPTTFTTTSQAHSLRRPTEMKKMRKLAVQTKICRNLPFFLRQRHFTPPLTQHHLQLLLQLSKCVQ